MFDLDTLNHFSRCNCVAICAALIPMNLLVSTAVIGLTAIDYPAQFRQRLAVLGSFLGLLLIAHVTSWWIAGVVAPATIILPSLAVVCSIVNWSCIARPTFVRFWYLRLRPSHPSTVG
jgi:hypothetical protein